MLSKVFKLLLYCYNDETYNCALCIKDLNILLCINVNGLYILQTLLKYARLHFDIEMKIPKADFRLLFLWQGHLIALDIKFNFTTVYENSI